MFVRVLSLIVACLKLIPHLCMNGTFLELQASLASRSHLSVLGGFFNSPTIR